MHSFFREELHATLSPLEKDVLTFVSEKKKVTGREVYRRLREKRSVAPSSVAVILDRLYKKGLVERITKTGKGGVHFCYSLRKDPRVYEQALLERAVNKLVKRFGNTALAYFNERFKEKDK